MKKLLLSLIAMVLGCCMVNADELYKLQFGTDANAGSTNQYNASAKWQITCNGTVWDCYEFSNNNLGWPNARCGTKTYVTTPYIVNNAAWDEQITEIVINAQRMKSGAADLAASAKILVASDTAAVSPAVAVDITSQINGLTTTASDITVAINGAPAGMYYKFVLECPKATNNGWLAINSITYNGTASSPKADPQLKFPESAYNATIGQTFASPKATQVGNGAITYSSSDTTIATVDANTGDVELVSGGECTITATSASTEEYNKGTASYLLTIVDPTIVYTGLEDSDTNWTAEDIKLGDGLTYVWKWDATNKYYKGSSYVSGAAKEANSYLVSPVIDLTGKNSAKGKFVNQLNYLNSGNRSDFVNVLVREQGSTEWKVVEVDTWPAGTNWTAVTSNFSLDAYAGKKIQLGFQYAVPAGSTIAPTWEVSKVVINGSSASTGEYVVYNNGTLGTGLVPYGWWNSTFDFNAANPNGTVKVMSFKAADGGAAASMGLNSETPDFCGKLHNATLNFKYYAKGTGTYTIRLTSIAEENYSFAVTAANANSWQTVSLPVAEKFPTVASEWNENKKDGKGYVFSIILENGSSDAEIYFDNIYYSNVDENWNAGEEPQYPAPADVPTPTQAPEDVMSVFSSAYDSVTTFNIGGWGQSTTVAEEEIDGNKVEKLTYFNYLGWELGQTINVSEMAYLHVDFWSSNDTFLKITPISAGPQEKLWTPTQVNYKEWSSYDIPLSYFEGVDMTKIFQIKFDGGKGDGVPCYIANVYFWKEGTSGVNSIESENDVEAVYYNMQGVRVDNPQKGIFVKVVNGKAVKVVK